MIKSVPRSTSSAISQRAGKARSMIAMSPRPSVSSDGIMAGCSLGSSVHSNGNRRTTSKVTTTNPLLRLKSILETTHEAHVFYLEIISSTFDREFAMQLIKVVIAYLMAAGMGWAANPIIESKGVCDPHISVYDNRVWLYADHDEPPKPNSEAVRNEWWIWSSTDQITWTKESVLRPESTYLKHPTKNCAGIACVTRNGKYYLYFSTQDREIGVMVSDTPRGPWQDPLGKPLVSERTTHTEANNPTVLMNDDGVAYLIYGYSDYFIVRLRDDMISIGDEPRRIVIDRKYGNERDGKTNDRPSLHTYGSRYYLSWGGYYAMAKSIYGPYTFKGSVIIMSRFLPGFCERTLTADRTGTYLAFRNQCYFACNDENWPGSSNNFRNIVMGYVHYRDNGEIEPVFISPLGVGQYDVSPTPVDIRPSKVTNGGAPYAAPLYDMHPERIEAENYFAAEGAVKRECPEGGFEMRGLRSGSHLAYPHVMNLRENTPASFRVSSANAHGGTVEVRTNGVAGPLLGTCVVPYTGGWGSYQTISCTLQNKAETSDIYLVFTGHGEELLRLDWIEFK